MTTYSEVVDDVLVRPLTDVPLRHEVELVRMDLADSEAEPLLERGLLPGSRLTRVRNSPFGDPIVLIEGTLLALRRETAGRLYVSNPRDLLR